MDKFEQMEPEFSIEIGTITRLTDADLMRIYEMTQAKVQAKKEYDIDQTFFGKFGSSFEMEKLSIGAEFSFARQLGVGDITTEDAVNNRPYDFKICGKTIDIKSTLTKDARLFVRAGKQFYCDWFLLFFRIDLRTFKFLGAAKKEELISDKTLNVPKGFKGQVYNLTQDKLKDFSL